MNIVFVVFDTLRKDCIGVYGEPFWGKVQTPNLDRFAGESLMFTGVYPEVLPTIPARRSIYTGKRVYPFHRGEFSLKGDFVGAAGWGPIPEEDDTLAEILQANGYRTGLISSLYHQFKPSKNYWRGFDQWTFVRGKENDPYRSGPEPTEEEIRHYLPEEMETSPYRREFIKRVIKNIRNLKHEEDYPVAQVMMESVRWLEENRDAKNFFLMVESFDPHEPWNVPVHYREMYDSETTREQILSGYSDTRGLPDELLKRTQANYSGLVSMCDRWFGYLYESIKNMGLLNDTVVIVTSDHGHSIGDRNYIGKRGYPSSPDVIDIPLFIKHPKGEGVGKKSDIIVQHNDYFSLVLGFSGLKYDTKEKGIDGKDFWGPALENKSLRHHVTIGWSSGITLIEGNWWMNCRANGKGTFLYDREKDPEMKTNIASDNQDVVDRLFSLAVKDAGGKFPDYILKGAEEAKDFPGCSAIAAKVSGL
jgi:arylsulfatase A-like enzyme